MADTRARDQTRPAQMGHAEMPAGQAPAVQRPMTAVQRRDAENAKRSSAVREALMAAVEQERLNIESFLSVFGISYDIFLAGLLVFLSKQQREQPDFFVDLNIPSFLEALTRIAMNGLLPDGKEAAIAAYANRDLGQKVAQPLFMRDGFVKVLWRTGMVKSINDQVVTEAEYTAGRFDYEEGDQGYIVHKLDLMRKDSDPVVAAYCLVELVGGGSMREVVPKDELDKMARMSKSPARAAWKHQMHRKGAIRRIMGKMPREKGIAQLLQHDDDGYRSLTPAELATDDEAPTRAQLFSNKPVRRKRREIPAVPAEPETIVAEQPDAEPQDGGDGPEAADDAPFVLRALLARKNGVQAFPPAEAEFWYGDIRQKMRALEGEALAAFWKANHGFIEDAGRNGYGEYAMQLIELAHELGLISRGGGQ